jgi:hypothetical protein
VGARQGSLHFTPLRAPLWKIQRQPPAGYVSVAMHSVASDCLDIAASRLTRHSRSLELISPQIEARCQSRRGRVPLRRVFDPAITPDDRLEPQITARAISTRGVRQLRLDTPVKHGESPFRAHPFPVRTKYELRRGDRASLSRPLEILFQPPVTFDLPAPRALLHATHRRTALHPHEGTSRPEVT